MQKGTLLRCKTITKNDMFGDVMWEVLETGLPAPEKERQGQMDGVKVIMLGGSGPSARAGLTLIDSEWHIQNDIAAGITSIVPDAQRESILARYKAIGKDSKMPRHGGTGVVEM